MFEILNKLLKTETTPTESLSFIHIDHLPRGTGIANPAFLTHHFISYFLKHQYKVCLVSLSQTLTQYKVIQNKLGCSLDKVIAEGLLRLVSLPALLTSPASGMCINCDSCDKNSQSADSKGIFNSLTSILYEKITLAFTELNTGANPCLLVLDDLDVLQDLGMSSAQILQFLCRLRSLHPAYYSTMLTVSCKYDPDVTLIEHCALNNQLIHWSCLSFTVDELTTGLSKDVHGQLVVRWMKRNSVATPQEDLYHYKISDRELRLFAVGASPAVL